MESSQQWSLHMPNKFCASVLNVIKSMQVCQISRIQTKRTSFHLLQLQLSQENDWMASQQMNKMQGTTMRKLKIVICFYASSVSELLD
jgi:hypothetical protein